MAINILVVGFSKVPVKEDFYDYLACIDRYEFAEIHGRINELRYQGEGFHALVLTIDVMIAMNDTNLYEVFLLANEDERELLCRHEPLKQFNKRFRHWLHGQFTHVLHRPTYTYACMEKIKVKELNEAISKQHLPLDSTHDKAPDLDEDIVDEQ